jgi:cysteinyl-tRNA synthetase
MIARFLILQSHYRSKIDFSNEALLAAEKGYHRLMTAVSLLEKLETPNEQKADSIHEKEILDAVNRCHQSMSDDFNTAQTLAALFDMATKINAIHNGQLDVNQISSGTFEKMKKTVNDFAFEILGLEPDADEQNSKTEDLVNLLIELRSEARNKKDFATSDKIRDDLQEIGIRLKDDKSGTTFEIDR